MKRTAAMVEESRERRSGSSSKTSASSSKTGPASQETVATAKKKSNPSVGATSTTSIKKRRSQTHPNSIRNLRPWKPGQSGNPNGRPKNDVAAQIARAIFERNPQMIYEAFGHGLKKGNPYAFDVLANRGFGKLTDKLEVTTEKELLDALTAGRKRAQARAKKVDKP